MDSGAKLADFGGWDMPIEYPQGTKAGAPGGVIAEHTAVRERVGLFDVSHLGKIQVTGDGALDYLNAMLTNDLGRIADGSAQYNLICNEAGGVIDDLIVYRRSTTDLFLVPNAANCAEVLKVLEEGAPAGLTISGEHQNYGVLALQGPLSKKIISDLGITIDFDYMAFTEGLIPGNENLGTVIICRTGYTGEYGFELIPSWDATVALWEVLVEAVSQAEGRVCGLGLSTPWPRTIPRYFSTRSWSSVGSGPHERSICRTGSASCSQGFWSEAFLKSDQVTRSWNSSRGNVSTSRWYCRRNTHKWDFFSNVKGWYRLSVDRHFGKGWRQVAD